ncbi:DUF5011 domain-containing protein [Cellulophaga baltica]|uniref:immunoglobulin-like domain-containing protein n=1 Tax=Cellulophaga TaxID=104264 RepID=UPI001C066B6B|nr:MULTISPECIES: immunoglobulin-like domain-containing protein [Cellulophaga]MBU2997464.1 DUF5011 domain-containing protein [Cellulophaga baltica]MDO6768861.1 DUF5011 domain-containing protein [Cellulophaga sp. 1_MG-2023]
MKKPTKYILSFISILLVIIACTKQVGLYTEVEFELAETHESEGYVNTALTTVITVTPEELVDGYSYSYSYKINNGSGYFEDESGTIIISEGEKIALDPLTALITYIPTEVGDHSIVFTAEDSFGFTEQVIATYSVTDIPVTWTASASTDQILLGDSEAITVVLGSETEDEEVTYQRDYSFTEGTSTLTTSEGADETLNELVEITPGTYELEFTATELGSVTIEFLLEDSNGQEVIATISFEVVEELDTTAPVITLLGESEITVTVGDTYIDEGATATDDIDGDLTSEIVTINPVDTSIAGEYTITYNVEDQAENNATEVIRTVTVVEELDTTPPVITLVGESEIIVTVGDIYVDEGATATDDVDGDITSDIVTLNPVDTSVAGEYTITYNVEDQAQNNATEVIRIVTVAEETDTTAPVITLVGESEITVTVGDVYIDEGATATDDVDGNLTSEIVTVNPVDTSVAGEYTITYNVTDEAQNNATEVIRIVTVEEELDTTAPVITLTGESEITLTVGDTYTDEGATATDDIDGNLTSEIVTVNPVDTSVAGEYTITYNVTDEAENNATEVIRIVTVEEEADTTAPVITLIGSNYKTITAGDSYTDQGATAIDDVDGDITSTIITVNTVDTNTSGEYLITYNVTDQAGNNAIEITRIVTVLPNYYDY